MFSSNRPKNHKGRLTPLSESLGRSLSLGSLNFVAQKLRVFEIWDRVVGPQDAARTRPVELQGGRLVVEVPGPVWLDRYGYQKSIWLEQLNRELADKALIEEIQLRIGEF